MHVIVIACDCLPLSLFGCYGNDWLDTPLINNLAHEGFVFENCFPENPAAGVWATVGLFGRAAPFVSLYGAPPLLQSLQQKGVHTVRISDCPDVFPDDAIEKGWSESLLIPPPPLEVRFSPDPDEVKAQAHYLVPSESDDEGEWLERWIHQYGWDRLAGDDADRSIEQVFATAIGWLTEHTGDDALVWLDVGFKSSYWLPPSDFRGRWPDEEDQNVTPILDPVEGLVGKTYSADELPRIRAGFAGRIAFLDAMLDEFFHQVDEILGSGTYATILTADSGLPLGLYGFIGTPVPRMVEERDHVPLIIRPPRGAGHGRIHSLVQASDLAPTLADMFGAGKLAGATAPGLTAFLRGERSLRRDQAFAGLNDVEYVIRTNQWKLVLPVRPQDGENVPPRRLYSKPEDRWDQNDVSLQSPEICDQLELELRRWLGARRRDNPW